MKTALILGQDNGVGLSQDSRLLSAALEKRGVEVRVPRIGNPLDILAPGFHADVAFHLERMAPWWWRRRARVNLLIPNQERFPRRLVGSLAGADRVLCKSLHAREIFEAIHPRAEHIGFTSPDRFLSSVEPDYRRFFHLAGRSSLKNTELVLQLWGRHPEWPRLVLVQHPDKAPARVPANVELLDRRVPDEELRQLQNSHGVHLCPSLSEGWGHYMVEAMSCRAVVLATDAPPMNELVASGRGVLVACHRREPRHLGWNYHVDPSALESAIQAAMSAPLEDLRAIGREARAWFLQNQQAFARRIEALDA